MFHFLVISMFPGRCIHPQGKPHAPVLEVWDREQGNLAQPAVGRREECQAGPAALLRHVREHALLLIGPHSNTPFVVYKSEASSLRRGGLSYRACLALLISSEVSCSLFHAAFCTTWCKECLTFYCEVALLTVRTPEA